MTRLAIGVPLLKRPQWNRLVDEHHDVLVVGGGIHGAGVARDAALRGLRVAVIERDDWGSGASSRSSKLLHGGLRYLAQGSFGLVREALRERERHLRLAPGLVQRVRFRVPPPPPGAVRRWKIRTGIALYDLLAGRRSEFWKSEPAYEDALVDDARFCLQVVLDARRHGALTLHYTEWIEWLRQGDRVVGARIRDRFTGDEGTVSATAFVNATGPWADLVMGSVRRLRLTRGTHVVLDRRADGDARLFFSPHDGRVLFLLPYGDGHSLLGTTDLDEAAPTRDPIPQRDEVQYLRDAFQSQFPDWAHWVPVGLQCGLRPLLSGEGSPSSLSREEKIIPDPFGNVISILGGKFTTFRVVAERATDRVLGVLGRPHIVSPTRHIPIPGIGTTGDVYSRVRQAFSEEEAVRLEDVFFRRTQLGHCGSVEKDLLEFGAKLWRLRWGLGAREAKAEIQAFCELQERRLSPLAAWKSSGYS